METVYVYLLESLKNGQRYIGQTCNLENRMRRHNYGYVRSTRNKSPWKLLAYIETTNRQDSVKTEQKLKQIKNRERVFRYFAKYGYLLPD